MEWSLFDEPAEAQERDGTAETIVGPTPVDALRAALLPAARLAAEHAVAELAAAGALTVADELSRALDTAPLPHAAEMASDVAQTCWARLTELTEQRSRGAREAYVACQLVQAALRADDSLAEALRHLDLALILGGPSQVLSDCFQILEGAAPPLAATAAGASQLPPPSELPALSRPVERRVAPDVDAFRPFFRENRPVLVEGAMTSWSACDAWADFDRLSERYGERLVPIEVGVINVDAERGGSGGEVAPAKRQRSIGGPGAAGAVDDSGWSERITTMRDFLSRLREAVPPEQKGYLAQHPLFDQMPGLRADFEAPRLCAVGRLQHINAWLGPAGTITPLHFDSYDNFLAQAVGFKYVRLYAESETARLYPLTRRGDGLLAQGNVSAVNAEQPDLRRFPLFADAEYTEAVLAPGEMLFIPARCWHFVRSLTPSFSLSFWF